TLATLATLGPGAFQPASSAELTLDAAVANPARSAKFVARDKVRHPVDELAFFGLTPQSTVVEIWPGGGYWTEILAPFLQDHGVYYVALQGKGETRLRTLRRTSSMRSSATRSRPISRPMTRSRRPCWASESLTSLRPAQPTSCSRFAICIIG